MERLEKLLEYLPEVMEFLRQTSLKKDLKIEKKGEIDLVTEADRGSETRLLEFILKYFPDDSIMGEEGTDITGKSDFKWILDPLDGTTNYSHNLPLYAISVGIENISTGDIVGGAVALPAFNDIYYSNKGKGAYKNKEKIYVSQKINLIDCLTCTGFPYNRKDELDFLLKILDRFLCRTRGIRRTGAAALDLVWLAEGRFDIFYEINLNPWDVAAGYLIIEEAGGCVTDFGGSKFKIDCKKILATNSGVHKDALSIFGEFFEI